MRQESAYTRRLMTMKNNKKKKIAVSVVAAILLVLLYLLIFAFFWSDGEESGSLSSMISEKIAELLNAISGKHWTQNDRQYGSLFLISNPNKLVISSSMHAWECCCTVCGDPGSERNRKLYLLIVLWCLSPPERTRSISYLSQDAMGVLVDVVLDTCGGAFGLLVCVCVEKIVRQKETEAEDREKRSLCR